ncbi:MAG: tripartite tricarboxylate transporter TctB family protein [Deltaproteobacteria bacterium]|nr:tripartite tricarboxylate transporter TctB family protein [Deltaproteobacteria bacterium]
MKIKIRSLKDFYSGVVFIVFGLIALVMSRSYAMGSAMRMGPGYFPKILGSLLILLGLIISFRSLLLTGEGIKKGESRPLIMVLVSVVVFAFLIKPLGLILATLALVVLSCLGWWEFRFREVVLLYIILAVLAVGLFIYGVGLPIKIWPL